MTSLNYVWYASYGSNLNEERFLCYIQGGCPVGSKAIESGCRNHTMPRENRSFMIPYSLYFSGNSSRWGGGAAFIGHQKDESRPTYGRMYLITAEQFIDVISQENQGYDVEVDLQEVITLGSQCIFDNSYGTIICLGSENEVPIFTFTANEDKHEREWCAPSEAYLGTIISGLIETHSLTNIEIIEYLMDKPLVQDRWTRESLNHLIASRRNFLKSFP